MALRRPGRGQLELALTSGWGGKRAGAGRKRAPGTRPGVPHVARPRHARAHPVHVTLRARAGITGLRSSRVFPVIRTMLRASQRAQFRVVQFSVQSDHVHMLIEAADRVALSRGLIGLSVRVARAVNRVLGRKGAVWGDRYHARPLTSPRAVRHAIVYVLANFRKHLRAAAGLDPCSSASWFDGWRARPRSAFHANDPPPVLPARTWLLRVGWRRHGLLSPEELPAAAG